MIPAGVLVTTPFPDELVERFTKLRGLKDRFGILNPAESLAEMTRFVKHEAQQFPCFGGYKYFAMDVNFDIYRCDFWATKMCSIEEFATARLRTDAACATIATSPMPSGLSLRR